MGMYMVNGIKHPKLGQADLMSEADTERLGSLLMNHLPPASVIGLCGTLGAGKTRLVQAMAKEMGIRREDVTSPTFTLMHTFHSHDRLLNHLDAYRIRDEDEFLELGIEETFDDLQAITVIEWADRFPHCLPEDALWIELELDATTRRADFFGGTGRWQNIISNLAAEMASERRTA